MSGVVHLVPTPEAFAEQVEREWGPEARLHPANRTTACGRRMGEMDVTVEPSRATCRACIKAGAR